MESTQHQPRGKSPPALNRGPNPTNIKRRPKVSVVLPCFNENDRILETLSKLFKQSFFKDAEIIICEYNPANDPYVRDLVERMAHVRYLEINRPGIAFARHMGIMKSNAQVICNFDGDCEFLNNKCLENMVTPILNKECILTVCDNLFDLVEVPVNELPRMDAPTKVANLINNLQRTTPLAILEPGSCISKEAYMFVGGYDDTKQYELFMLNNRLMYHYNSFQNLLFGGKRGQQHKKHIPEAAVIVSSRRAIKWSERGLEVLDYNNNYR